MENNIDNELSILFDNYQSDVNNLINKKFLEYQEKINKEYLEYQNNLNIMIKKISNDYKNKTKKIIKDNSLNQKSSEIFSNITNNYSINNLEIIINKDKLIENNKLLENKNKFGNMTKEEFLSILKKYGDKNKFFDRIVTISPGVNVNLFEIIYDSTINGNKITPDISIKIFEKEKIIINRFKTNFRKKYIQKDDESDILDEL